MRSIFDAQFSHELLIILSSICVFESLRIDLELTEYFSETKTLAMAITGFKFIPSHAPREIEFSADALGQGESRIIISSY